MKIFERSDRSTFGMWLWNIDFKFLGMILLLILAGILLLMSSVSIKTFYMLNKQLVYLCLAIPTMLFFSFLEVSTIRRIAFFGLLLFLIAAIYTISFGEEINGAKRWIRFLNLSIQPSEFIKPFFAVINAWLLSLWIEQKHFPGRFLSILLSLIILVVLLLQPDIGMSFIIATSWLLQIFLSGLSFNLIIISMFLLVSLFIILYNFSFIEIIFPHVQKRIEDFWNGNGFQIEKSLNAFSNGGWFGTGFGEGSVKTSIPDSQTDFIFSVAGEELGIIGASLIIFAYSIIFLRGMLLTSKTGNIFILLSCSTLIMQFFLQAAVHMASTLDMIPTKGMTLPFISYGGSSLISSSIAMGILLAMTKKNIYWNNS